MNSSFMLVWLLHVKDYTCIFSIFRPPILPPTDPATDPKSSILCSESTYAELDFTLYTNPIRARFHALYHRGDGGIVLALAKIHRNWMCDIPISNGDGDADGCFCANLMLGPPVITLRVQDGRFNSIMCASMHVMNY